MYYSHFGLKLPPFKITSDTEFFFTGGQRGAILDALVYAISSGEGIVKVVGEVGSGKTMLCRMLQSLLPKNVESVYLANPSVAPEDILYAIAFELQLPLPDSTDRLHVMHALQEYLLARHSENKHVVIFIEEAQSMPLETLEEIRLLSNLETRHDKLLQIILFGQPELDANLNQPQIRQLRERITHSFNLGPLEEKDIGEYLNFRMRTAGYFGPPLFSKGAIRKIAQASVGLVRRINILADKALLAAFADSVYAIKPKHVETAIRDSEFDAERVKQVVHRQSYWLPVGMLAAGLGLGFALHTLVPSELSWPILESAVELPPADEALPAKLEAPQAVAPANEGAAQTELASVQLVSEQASPPLPANAEMPKPEAVAPVTSVVQVQAVQLLSSQLEMRPVDTLVEMPKETAVTATQALAPQQGSQAAAAPADILEARLQATKQWLSEQAPTTVSIQVLGTDNEGYMRSQLKSMSKLVEGEQLFVYRHMIGGSPYLTLLYGSFQTRSEAKVGLGDLPKNMKAFHPKLRTVEGIKKDI